MSDPRIEMTPRRRAHLALGPVTLWSALAAAILIATFVVGS